jgi:predicted RNase H-like HicB family nuclease
MGQLLEWPEVVTEGNSLDDCRLMLIDAFEQMVIAYRELGLNVPQEKTILEEMHIELDYVH